MTGIKPQDILVLLKIVALRRQWTLTSLAGEIFISASETHAAMVRLQQAGLINQNRVVKVDASLEFLTHGVQYSFFAVRGEITRGMPTSIAAPPLIGRYFDEPELPPVWPHPMGLKKGYSFEPLHKKAPDAASADSSLYELLALVDAIREGSARVKPIAVREIEMRLSGYSNFERW